MANTAALISAGLLYLVLSPGIASEPAVPPVIHTAGLHQAQWAFDGSSAICELQHEIPGFGVSRFQRIAGGDLRFRIDGFQPLPRRIAATLREVSPGWRHARPDPYTLSVTFGAGTRPLALESKPAARVLSSLARGQAVSVDFLEWDEPRRPVHVRLSPVNFQQAYAQFRRCLRVLSPQGFEAYRQTEIRFPLDGFQLDAEAKQVLQELSAYVKADASIKRMEIAAHADDQGSRRYNKRLTARRADCVFEHLRQAGVDAERMRRSAYGEARPKLAGRSDSARAANRRVLITLVRD